MWWWCRRGAGRGRRRRTGRGEDHGGDGGEGDAADGAAGRGLVAGAEAEGDRAAAGFVRVDDHGAGAVVTAPAGADRVHGAAGAADRGRPGGVPGVGGVGRHPVVGAAAAAVPLQQEGGLAVAHLVRVGADAVAAADEVLAEALGGVDDAEPAVEEAVPVARGVVEEHLVGPLLEVLDPKPVDVGADRLPPATGEAAVIVTGDAAVGDHVVALSSQAAADVAQELDHRALPERVAQQRAVDIALGRGTGGVPRRAVQVGRVGVVELHPVEVRARVLDRRQSVRQRPLLVGGRADVHEVVARVGAVVDRIAARVAHQPLVARVRVVVRERLRVADQRRAAGRSRGRAAAAALRDSRVLVGRHERRRTGLLDIRKIGCPRSAKKDRAVARQRALRRPRRGVAYNRDPRLGDPHRPRRRRQRHQHNHHHNEHDHLHSPRTGTDRSRKHGLPSLDSTA